MLTFNNLGRLGRLGNGLFQVASTIGLAQKHGYAYGFPTWRNYDHVERFGFQEDIDVHKYFLNPLPGRPEGVHFEHKTVDWGYQDLHLPDRNFSLDGHMQSEKYFAHCAELVRHYFTLDDTLFPAHCRDLADEQNTCGIHIRRGDYDNDYHPFCTAQYYHEAMAMFPEATKWMVFSDAPARAREIVGPHAEYVEGQHYMNDFYMMTRCKNFIICNSTFSWWGAWLIRHPGKVVISPSADNWFGQVAGINGRDIIPSDWLQVEF
jgi:hypothetical protein